MWCLSASRSSVFTEKILRSNKIPTIPLIAFFVFGPKLECHLAAFDQEIQPSKILRGQSHHQAENRLHTDVTSQSHGTIQLPIDL